MWTWEVKERLQFIPAQILVGFLLTHDLPANERLYLAFAQQNGITAMILALFFEKDLVGTVGIVAPAVIFINLGYYFFNGIILSRQADVLLA